MVDGPYLVVVDLQSHPGPGICHLCARTWTFLGGQGVRRQMREVLCWLRCAHWNRAFAFAQISVQKTVGRDGIWHWHHSVGRLRQNAGAGRQSVELQDGIGADQSPLRFGIVGRIERPRFRAGSTQLSREVGTQANGDHLGRRGDEPHFCRHIRGHCFHVGSRRGSASCRRNDSRRSSLDARVGTGGSNYPDW